MTFKSYHGKHIVTAGAITIVFSTIGEALRFGFKHNKQNSPAEA